MFLFFSFQISLLTLLIKQNERNNFAFFCEFRMNMCDNTLLSYLIAHCHLFDICVLIQNSVANIKLTNVISTLSVSIIFFISIFTGKTDLFIETLSRIIAFIHQIRQIRIAGDLILGGVFPVHSMSNNPEEPCGEIAEARYFHLTFPIHTNICITIPYINNKHIHMCKQNLFTEESIEWKPCYLLLI